MKFSKFIFALQERATLKHRNGSKRIQQLSKFANKNPEFMKNWENQIRLGRELAQKHGVHRDTESEDSDIDANISKMSVMEMLEVFLCFNSVY